jgi:hypothetical protein
MPEKFIGQHTSTGPAPNNGQRTISRDPELGKKAVPPSRRDADTSTESEVARGKERK